MTMAGNFEDTVFGFDLNFLHQTTDNNLLQSRIDKQRLAMLKAKKKTICTDSLIRKYHEKQQLLEEIQKDLMASKEECKQICIEYKSSLDKCSKLETKTMTLQTINHELEKKLMLAKNQQEGILSHTNQLQILIKDYETRIEALKIENQLEKNNTPERDKNIAWMTKDNRELTKHIHVILNVALKNNNLNGKDKTLLNKYKKIYKYDESSQEDYIENEEVSFENYECNENTNCLIDANVHSRIDKPLLKLDDIDRDSNGSNEIVSIDTGRGSSLAFSDSDKCFHSPEYFSDDSPPCIDALNNEDNKTFANKATSPINKKTNNAALSPIKELQTPDVNDKQTTGVKRSDIATSPIKCCNKSMSYENNRDRKCLDSNNSCFLSGDDNSNDCEIETILSSMRLNHNLITPIPSTPSKSLARTTSISEHSEHVCLDAAKVREENKTLQTTLANLAKEVMSIKSMLKFRLITEESNICQTNVLTKNDPCTLKIHEHESAPLSIANEKSVFDTHRDTESQCSIASLDTVVNDFPPAEDDAFINQSTENDENYNLLAINDTLPINASRNLLFEEDPETNADLGNLSNHSNLNISIHGNCNIVPQVGKKNIRKLTRLQRLRVKMLPKGKIPIARSLPQRKLRMKPRLIKIGNKKPNKTDFSATLNKKEVYEKAVKVMAELKSKNMQKESKASEESSNYNVCDVDVNSNEKFAIKTKNNTVSSDSSQKHQNLNFDNTSNSIPCTDTVDVTPKASINTRSRSKLFDTEATVSMTQKDDANEISSTNSMSQSDKGPNPKTCAVVETRNKRKSVKRPSCSERETQNKVNCINEKDQNSTPKIFAIHETQEKRKSLKRTSFDEPEMQNKRVLRSSSAHLTISNNSDSLVKDTKQCDKTIYKEGQFKISHELDARSQIPNYSDLDIFTHKPTVQSSDETQNAQEIPDSKAKNPQESVLCAMLEKYGIVKIKNCNTKVSESVISTTCKKIQDGIAKIIELPQNETKSAMNTLVEGLRKCQLKHFLNGLMHYLKDPVRKAELFNKVYTSSAPPMTKSEQVLLYILTNLQGNWRGVDFIGCVLDSIEYTLFKLNRTPDFDTIESMSHFYAVLCRYMKNKSRLRLFILDAMYCIQFKAVPLIKQCMEVWMHILPLAHLGIAKSPLVMCVVYLLHFFKCEDRFNRVMEIRNILSQKYFYKFSDWNETKILDMFRSSIKELKGNNMEKKMLRLALILLAKRQGPQWCQNNIINNLLQPMIENENSPDKVKIFCLSMVGPLLKPYPVEMKVHCEIVMNQLIDLIYSTSSPCVLEAIFASLIYMSKHNPNRVVQELLSWSPKNVSPEMEGILKGYVREKPLKIWKQQLSRLH